MFYCSVKSVLKIHGDGQSRSLEALVSQQTLTPKSKRNLLTINSNAFKQTGGPCCRSILFSCRRRLSLPQPLSLTPLQPLAPHALDGNLCSTGGCPSLEAVSCHTRIEPGPVALDDKRVLAHATTGLPGVLHGVLLG